MDSANRKLDDFSKIKMNDTATPFAHPLSSRNTKKTILRQCVKSECNNEDLIYLRLGWALQTNNGFLIAKMKGWYCFNCAASYGK